jgi:carboxymethylenebutenolidase
VNISAPDGTIDGVLVRPDGTAPLPAVIVLPDIFGVRPAIVELGERIADHGYVVLLPNMFYRTAGQPGLDLDADFRDAKTTARFRELTSPVTPDAMARDGSAYVDFLGARSDVKAGPMGVVGFCFAGKFALRIAAARPDRIAAAASFHGGGLIDDSDASPHLVLPRVKAHLYFGHAEGDRSMTPDAIAKFEAALRAWGGSFESEIYEGAGHGWMMSDREVFNPPQAKRGFDKLMALFSETLGGKGATA